MALVQANSRARINEFLSLFIQRPPTAPPLTPEEFLTDISPKYRDIPPTTEIIYYIDGLKPFPSAALPFDNTKPLASGAYGDIYETTDRRYILKFIVLGPRPPITATIEEDEDYIMRHRDIIKETFIQHYLQTEPDAELSSKIPKIHGIYLFSKRRGIIVIQMDRADITVHNVWNNLVRTSPDRKVPFDYMNAFLSTLINTLARLYEKYLFSHRDLKLNNIMLSGANMKLIDFGMSALTVNLDGTLYRIVNEDQYQYDIACSPKQDLGLLFTFIYEYFYIPGLLDNKGVKLLNKLFTGNKNTVINNTAKQTPGTFAHKLKVKHDTNLITKPGIPLWHSAYNFKGNLYPDTCPISSAFSLENVSRILTEVETSAGGGGKRRKTRRNRLSLGSR